MIIKVSATITLFLLVIILSYSFSRAKTKIEDPKALFELYCGSCHLPPGPKDLPKEIWKGHVLPASEL